MAGGAGVEYYFGYQLPEHDLLCQDWRSRDRSWDYCRIALDFFADHRIPFWEMTNADPRVGNANHDNSRYCFAKANELYLVFLPSGGTTSLDLKDASGKFQVFWFSPRSGGPLRRGATEQIQGGALADLGAAPADVDQDWVVLVRR
jgi:hypothetical protein